MKLAMMGRTPEEMRTEAGKHGLRLTGEEWRQALAAVGRDLTLPEAFLYDVSWSEHCSYKSSRALLKTHLPPLASHVLLGPGEDAGVVSLGLWGGEEWTLVVAHESHNHPSQVLPVEGAATGVGGIVRDVYCMGADVIGVLDALRFGDPSGPNRERVRGIVRGVVQGVAEYGNALGVPNAGGDVAFHEGFDDNCLVNVVAFGVAPRRRIIRSRVPEAARAEEYALVLVGKPTDATGLGGASFASQILDEEEAAENRGAVQIHDPFLKRVLVEATKDAWRWIEEHQVAVGCKDLGAGGLGGASSELVFAGGFGAEIELEQVPQGLPDLAPHEVLCGETQERFVWAVPKRLAAEFCAIWNERYDLARTYPNAAAAIIGRVTEERVYRCRWHGDLVVDLSAAALETLPQVPRPVAPRSEAGPIADPPPPREDPGGAGWQAWAESRLAAWNASSRAAVYRFYDAEVQGLAFLRPGEAAAGMVRPIPGESLGVAVSVDGNPDYGRLDPYWAGVLAVTEAVRNVVAAGARPLCLTDCLNFGNPEDPVALGELDAALRGMAEACAAIGAFARPEEALPIVSGNVSLYNFSSAGRSIPPSPIVACFGVIDDYGRALTPRLKEAGSYLIVTGARERVWGSTTGDASPTRGRVPKPDLAAEAREIRAVLALAEAGLLRGANDLADGGLLAALFTMATDEERCVGLGARIDLAEFEQTLAAHEFLLSESPGFVLEVDPERIDQVEGHLHAAEVDFATVGLVTPGTAITVLRGDDQLAELDLVRIHARWSRRLESLLYHNRGAGLEGAADARHDARDGASR
ncbi:MAG: phosphoribosylformylglycinamidine synthase subunit PurL [Candidatus Eisenbacteria bacterium]|nr:phosphoribosylformylglycinamidine synthase subunit PurL [Candidatus Eisenbacteria bacterium]MCC7141261.1 phosphoribosylformylglycinamidine synthase subunit PurL [Candidatus Eisenbacteria bacterium]